MMVKGLEQIGGGPQFFEVLHVESIMSRSLGGEKDEKDIKDEKDLGLGQKHVDLIVLRCKKTLGPLGPF